ncbi:hypothetical protein [Actinomadura opuntiae]|uniref:hypothetical protein n=1 Tax=Actinomadura sp. OS1-43 TaxID=604315 RepID=UPI00255B1578|nr:hypothetical protein [Actinomadura sp. OS1-43]MDL4817564.1 hypothetical protein [Actinomadura sp. OS1-43]
MAHQLKDLTEVMEAESARGLPSPDLLDGVRRRVRRGNRLRAAAAALSVVLVAGTAFGIVRQQDGSDRGRQALAPTMTGVTNEAFPRSAPEEGMQPLKEVRFSKLLARARLTVTPTGPFMGTRLKCSGDFMVFMTVRGANAGGGCGTGSPDANSTSLYQVTPGVPITIDVVAVPSAAYDRAPDAFDATADLDRYLKSHTPAPGDWSLRIYSGQCDSEHCRMAAHPPRQQAPLPVTGLKRLARASGTADGRTRTVPLKTKALRMRVTCVDGAATAVVRIGGHAKVVPCEAAESEGVVWDAQLADGADGLEIVVLPAEAGEVHGTGDAALAKLMRGAKPAGKWTLDVYAR